MSDNEEQIRRLQMQINDLRSRMETMGNTYGWIEGQWQKNPLEMGYSDVVRGGAANSALSAGTNQLDCATVPAGEVWCITNIVYRYVGTVASVSLAVTINDGSGMKAYLASIVGGTVASSKFYVVESAGPIILKAGEFIRLTVFNATANNSAAVYISGWKFKIDQ